MLVEDLMRKTEIIQNYVRDTKTGLSLEIFVVTSYVKNLIRKPFHDDVCSFFAIRIALLAPWKNTKYLFEGILCRN